MGAVKGIVLELNGKELTFSIEDARELHELLMEVFDKPHRPLLEKRGEFARVGPCIVHSDTG